MSAIEGIFMRPRVAKRVLRAMSYTWHDADGTPAPGIGIFVGRRLIQHLTTEQALVLANQIADGVGEAKGQDYAA